jgi:hypothetical protein
LSIISFSLIIIFTPVPLFLSILDVPEPKQVISIAFGDLLDSIHNGEYDLFKSWEIVLEVQADQICRFYWLPMIKELCCSEHIDWLLGRRDFLRLYHVLEREL